MFIINIVNILVEILMQTNNSLLFISVKFFSNNDEKQHLTDNFEAARGIILGIGIGVKEFPKVR